ncbi:MAG: dTMP kinase [Candidatus Pacebacteria bacterium]|nr:dTMP kinase [Candidatus Paceibacterota bacterium]
MSKKQKGTFIVLDGGEGAGKTTVAKALVEKLGWNAIYTREPGGSQYAEKIRELLLSDEAKHSDAETQFALFWAARRDFLKHVVKPALEDGKTVITDRFDSSTYAYQIVAQGNSELEKLFWQVREVFLGDLQPDMYILLDIDPQEGINRAHKRGDETLNHFDKRKMDFHMQVNGGLREFILKKIDNGEVVDASQPLNDVITDTLALINKIQE